MLNIGVLVSGNGSNLQSIIDHIEAGRLSAEIRVVISDNSDAHALRRSQRHRIPAVVVSRQEYPERKAFDQRVADVLNSYAVELVVMAGFMRILSPLFLNAFSMRIMNIHPALLPSFPGVHAQEKAVASGVKFSGCTVHFADEGVDTGPIIIQSVVPVYEEDTAETLAERILKEEHRIYPQAIQFFAEGKIEICGRKVRIRNGGIGTLTALHNPPLKGF